jgi:hypothetical protein
MKEADFEALSKELTTELQLTEDIAKTGRARVDGVEVVMIYNEKSDPDQIHCYVDMGVPNPQYREAIYAEFLKSQLFLVNKLNGVFGLDPMSGHCVLATVLPVPTKPDAKRVAERLRVYALQAKMMEHLMANGPQAPQLPQTAHAAQPQPTAGASKPQATSPHPGSATATATAQAHSAAPAHASTPAVPAQAQPKK